MKPRLLDLFCGAGGVAMGYYRAGFEVVGVDIKPQPHYPFEFHQADALTYPLEGFDAYHASPPCQGYSDCTPLRTKGEHPKLIELVVDRFKGTNKPWVVENVRGAKAHLDNPLMLCGTMFGLGVHRHRYFEMWQAWYPLLHPCIRGAKVVYLAGSRRDKQSNYMKGATIKEQREATLIDWMTTDEIAEAIPPAYTEYIGKYLMKEVITIRESASSPS